MARALGFFLIILLILDLYTLQAVRTVIKGRYLFAIYLLAHTAVLSYFVFQVLNYDRSIGPTQGTLRASGLMVLFYVPKLIVFAVLAGEDVFRIAEGAYHWVAAKLSGPQEQQEIVLWHSRRKFISQFALGLAAIPMGSILYGIAKGRYNFKVLREVMYFDDLPAAFDGFTITQISDAHAGSFDNPDKIRYAMELINAQKSDVILFTGDLVNHKAEEMKPWVADFATLEAPYGKYSILGNHDYGDYSAWRSEEAKRANFQDLLQVHRDIGFDLLLNEHRTLERDGQQMHLLGVENWGQRPFRQSGDLNKATEGLDKDSFKVLMSHDPSHFDEEVKQYQKSIQLTLAGHTHGFQFGIEIPGWLKWSPVKYRYPKWAGKYSDMGSTLYVNRGLGYHAFPGRVGIWPEITVIELRKGKA